MEKNKNDIKFTPTSQGPETNDFSRKEDQTQTSVSLTRKNSKTSSPPHNNAPVLQWGSTHQPTPEPSSTLSCKPCLSSQQTPPIVSNPWQTSFPNPPQPQQHQPSFYNYHAQHSQPPVQLTTSNGVFWPHPGFHVPGATIPAAYQAFGPVGLTDATWQSSNVSGGVAQSRNEPQVPGFYYQGGCSHPLGFPGPWDSSPPCTYTFPGGYGYLSLPPPPVPDNYSVSGRTHQRGIIRPAAKLSQKHQQMWKAQSTENVQLWTAIAHMQSEMAAYGSRLSKLEADILSLKPTVVEESTGTEVVNRLDTLAVKTSKRGRPRKPIPSNGVLPSLDESQPRTRERKLQCKLQPETTLNFDKKCLSEVEESEAKITNIFPNIGTTLELNGNNFTLPPEVQATSMLSSQDHQVSSRIQVGGTGFNPTPEMKGHDNKAEEQKTAFSILPRHAKGTNTEAASATYIGTTDNGSHGWTSNILSTNCGRDLLDIRSHSVYDNGSVLRQEGKVFSGWSFVNEEDASEEQEDALAESGKDNNEDEEEMEDDVSS